MQFSLKRQLYTSVIPTAEILECKLNMSGLTVLNTSAGRKDELYCALKAV